MKIENIMKGILYILIVMFSFSLAFANENDTILLPYNATSLTPEQQESNPTILAYPTALKNIIPEMKCIYTFTIDAEGNAVEFSKGNLQYQASTDTWRFAEHQWDFVGNDTKGTVYENGVKCDNTLISDTYTGWIDLFGFGTSGWVSGEDCYKPTCISTNAGDYMHYDLVDDAFNGRFYANADWGVYNQIGEYPSNTWRTLTASQWEYIMNSRTNASSLIGKARVNNVTGMVVLPDEWVCPAGLSFQPSVQDGSYNHNVYTEADWEIMEKYGAIFLPYAETRSQEGSDVIFGGNAIYWSSTHHTGGGWIDAFHFWESGWAMMIELPKNGASVRLVKDVVE